MFPARLIHFVSRLLLIQDMSKRNYATWSSFWNAKKFTSPGRFSGKNQAKLVYFARFSLFRFTGNVEVANFVYRKIVYSISDI